MVHILGSNGKRIPSPSSTYQLGPSSMRIENSRKELEMVLYLEQVQCSSCNTVLAMPARQGPNEPPNLPSPCPNPACRGIDTYQEMPRAPGAPPQRTFNPESGFFLAWLCAAKATEALEDRVQALERQLEKVVAENKELQETLLQAFNASDNAS